MRFTPLLFAPLLASCAGSEPPTPSDWTLDILEASAGFSLRVPAFEVPAGAEYQNCYFVQVPDLDAGKEVWVNRVHTAINPGSHHLNVFRVKTVKELGPAMGAAVKLGELDGMAAEGKDQVTHPCWKSANWSDWPLVANSQNSNPNDPYTDWTLPTDVAIRMTPGEWLMIQVHYVNTTSQPTPNGAKVGINFHRYSGANPQELGTLFATQQSIRVCRSNPSPSYEGTCKFPSGSVTVTAANGHFHRRGEKFTISSWDGTSETHPETAAQFYESKSWDEPPMTRDLSIAIPAGGGIWWDCQYKWREPVGISCDDVDKKDASGANDCCYTFGGNTELSEHCNVFLYYWPKVESTDVFCN
ncbi:MAG: hypothetical protein HY791_09795 [Deltaproteobacteria bacterium]|nr:hypothetical protein [Deltaproteobacteria bacterium]